MSSEKVGSDVGGKKRPPKGHKRDSQGNPSGRSVGEALRDIYHGAVAEPVPDEMLDLLNKLG